MPAEHPAPHDPRNHIVMKVTEKDVACTAGLANLELTDEERGRMLRDLNSILDYIDRLNELDTANVPPMTQVSKGYKADASREDVVEGLRPSLPHDLALQNAPGSDGTFFKVPKVIEK
jgi:aspartyl-tRNA(Asn)/glutamyl-tRNA(Gln) amidotransferase subunit C